MQIIDFPTEKGFHELIILNSNLISLRISDKNNSTNTFER